MGAYRYTARASLYCKPHAYTIWLPAVLWVMGKKCVAFGCSNTHKDGVALFKFPSDPHLLKKWVDQVKRTREKWEPTEHSVLCSAHFEVSCIEADSILSKSPGFAKRKNRLKADAVPTIFPRPKKHADESELMPPPAPKRKRVAYEKRQRTRVICNHSS